MICRAVLVGGLVAVWIIAIWSTLSGSMRPDPDVPEPPTVVVEAPPTTIAPFCERWHC